MKTFILLCLLSLNAQAAFKIQEGMVQPVTNAAYPLKTLIIDYANLVGVNVTFPKDQHFDKAMSHFELNTPVNMEEFKKMVYDLIAHAGYTPRQQGKILWIENSRDIRYNTSPVASNNDFAKDASYVTYVHRLKYPLSSEIARNIRPFMSRYGRIIDLADARTLIICDRGDNVERLLNTIKQLDLEQAYKNLLAEKPNEDAPEMDPIRQRMMELELEKKLLEKKYLELKGVHQ